jgi:transposase InsO family protein
MQNHSIETSKVIVTTDCGLEFDGTTVHSMDEGFHKTITNPLFNATHRFNPPARPNFNADVESFHNTVESEFYFYTPFVNKIIFSKKQASISAFSIWLAVIILAKALLLNYCILKNHSFLP